jgi:hypothetical protein
MRKPDTSSATVRLLAAQAIGLFDLHQEIAATLRALVDERDAAIAACDEAIRMMGDASRQAGSWQGISEGKDIVIRQLEAERDAAIAASRRVSRKAGEWRDIAKRKDVVIKQLRAKLCAAFLDRLAANDSPLLDAEAAYQATRRARCQDGGQDQ